MPSMPSRATASALCHRNPGALDSSPCISATATNSVFVGPGHTAVHETPVPSRSVCSASEKASTNALVAE
jgi:hypothetical protein